MELTTVDVTGWTEDERAGIDWGNPYVVTSSPYGETLTRAFPTEEAAQDEVAFLEGLKGTYMTSWGEQDINTEASVIHYVTSSRKRSTTYSVRDLDTLEVLGTGLSRDDADDIMYSRYGAYSLVNETYRATYGDRGSETLIYYSGWDRTLTGDQPLSTFARDDVAYDYANQKRACVYDDSTGREVYCFRADH